MLFSSGMVSQILYAKNKNPQQDRRTTGYTKLRLGRDFLKSAKEADDLATIRRNAFNARNKFIDAIDFLSNENESLKIAYSGLAETYLLLENCDKTKEYCEHALIIDPNFSWPHRILGLAYSKFNNIRNFNEAKRHLDKAIDLNSDDKENKIALIEMYFYKGEYKLALNDFLASSNIIYSIDSLVMVNGLNLSIKLSKNISNLKNKLIKKLINAIEWKVKNNKVNGNIELKNILRSRLPNNDRGVVYFYYLSLELLEKNEVRQAKTKLQRAENFHSEYFESEIDSEWIRIKYDTEIKFSEAKIIIEDEDIRNYDNAIQYLKYVFESDSSYMDFCLIFNKYAKAKYHFGLAKLYLRKNKLPDSLTTVLKIIENKNRDATIKHKASFLLAVKSSLDYSILKENSYRDDALEKFAEILLDETEFQAQEFYFKDNNDIQTRLLFAEAFLIAAKKTESESARIHYYENGVAQCDSVLKINENFTDAKRLKEKITVILYENKRLKKSRDLLIKATIIVGVVLLVVIGSFIKYKKFTDNKIRKLSEDNI